MRPFRWSLLWALVILVLCLFPGQRLPDWNWVALFDLDKLVHAFLFFVLALLLAQALQTQGKLVSYLVWAVIRSMAYGMATEFMQGLEALGRRTDLNDMIANTLGAMAGGAYARWRKDRDRPLVPFAFLR